jgi:hypothetical protein
MSTIGDNVGQVMGPASIRALFFTVLMPLVPGCSTMLLEPPELATDAGIDAAHASPDAAPGARSCPPAPPGCVRFECAGASSCYYSCSMTASWDVAQNYCLQVGCLATVTSAAEQACITTAMAPTAASPVWIGFYQSSTAGEPANGWTWKCGGSTYTNWGAYEPNDFSGNEDCAEVGKDGRWDDTACNNDRRFVCKLP